MYGVPAVSTHVHAYGNLLLKLETYDNALCFTSQYENFAVFHTVTLRVWAANGVWHDFWFVRPACVAKELRQEWDLAKSLKEKVEGPKLDKMLCTERVHVWTFCNLEFC